MEPKLKSLHRGISTTNLLSACVCVYMCVLLKDRIPLRSDPGTFECVCVYVYLLYDQKGRRVDKVTGIRPNSAIAVSSTEL